MKRLSTEAKAQYLVEICADEVEMFKRKNTDYGDSFAKLRREMPTAVLVRIYDKFSRLAQLMNGNAALVKDESIDDTLADLAAYCHMELMERRIDKEEVASNA
jgi:glutaredoxin 2